MLCKNAKQLGRAIVLINASTLPFKQSFAFSTYNPFASPIFSFSYSSLPVEKSSNQGTFSNLRISSLQQIIYNNPETDAFVARIYGSTSEETLKEFFAGVGEIVSAKISVTPEGALKGYAFIRFADPKSLNLALLLSEGNWMKNYMKVVSITNKTERDNRTIFVGNISKYVTEEELYLHFSQYGKVYNTLIKTDNQGQPKRYAFVELENNKAARKACSSSGLKLDGRALNVKIAFNKANTSNIERDEYKEHNKDSKSGVNSRRSNERRDISRRDIQEDK